MEPADVGGRRFRTAFVVIFGSRGLRAFSGRNLAFPETSPARRIAGRIMPPTFSVDYAAAPRSAIARRDRHAPDSFHRRGWAIERISWSGRATGAGRQ